MTGSGESHDNNRVGWIASCVVLLVLVTLGTIGVLIYASKTFYSKRQVGCLQALSELSDMIAIEKNFQGGIRQAENNLLNMLEAKQFGLSKQELRELFEDELML